jgi:hypothetical protein
VPRGDKNKALNGACREAGKGKAPAVRIHERQQALKGDAKGNV